MGSSDRIAGKRTLAAGSRRARAVAAALVLLTLAVAVGAAQAGKGVTGFFGSQGTSEGQFTNPRDVAVNLPGGDSGGFDGYVYVVDEDNNRIQAFDGDGEFRFTFGSGVDGGSGFEICSSDCVPGSANDEGAGGLDDPQGIDIRQDTGQVFVRDRDNLRVQVFDADGSFAYAFGAGVNATTPGNLCTASSGDTCKVGVQGTAPGAFGPSTSVSTGLAIDQSSGLVFVADPGSAAVPNRRIQVFDIDDPSFDGTPAGVSEVQELVVDGGSGTFTLAYDGGTTDPVDFDAPATGAGSVQEALEGLPAIEPGDIAVTGGPGAAGGGTPYEIAFGGALAKRDVPAIVADGGLLDAGSGSATISTVTGGWDGTLGGNGAGNGQFGANQPVHLAAADGLVFASDTNTQLECFDLASRGVCSGGPVTDFPSSTATTALEIDPASGNVLAGRGAQIEELDVSSLPATNTDDPHLVASGVTTVGIGVAGSTIYAASTSLGSHRVFTVDTTAAPGASIDPVDFTAQHATFSGSVDPNGSPTGYHFEYVDHAEYQANGWTNATRAPLGADVDLGGGDSPVDVEQSVSNLKPNTQYHVRLVAKQTYGTTTGVAGGPDGVTFTTPGLLPAIVGTGARGDGATAELWATVEPNNSPTTYYFEYGTTTAYGSETASTSLDASDEAELVSAPLSGLDADTVYHYRVVATNGEGTTEGPDRTLTTSPAPAPAARGFELVNHVDMGGSYAQYPQTFETPGTRAKVQHPGAPSGERFIFRTSSPVPGTNATRSTAAYVAERTSHGWTQHYVGAPGDRVATGDLTHFAEDLGRVGLGVEGSAGVPGTLDPDDPGDAFDYYWHDLDGTFTWATRRSPAVDSANPLELYQSSPDGAHWVYITPVPAGDPPSPLLAAASTGQEVVSVLPDGGIARSGSGGLQQADAVGYGAPRISPDGDRVVFRARPTGVNSGPYLTWVRRRSDERTVQVDAPAPGVGSIQQQSSLDQLSRDGSSVLFTTSQQLTVEDRDDQVDLYRFEIDAEQIELVSEAALGAAGDGQGEACAPSYPVSGCEVLPGTYSRDGRTAYFVSPERLATGAKQGAPNLYVRRGGTTTLVAELVPGDVLDDPDTTSARSWYSDFEPYRPARVTDDGSRLVFESRAQLTAYDNHGDVEIYVYDANSGSVSCASCARGSLGPNAEAQLRSPVSTHFPNFSSFFQIQGRNITAGAEQVYFQTTERLVSEDINGGMDVYEYDVDSGRIALISSGTAPRGEFYFDNSVDGDHVFFASSQQLVPPEQDRNGDLWKIFDAHRAGGFPGRPPALGCTEADCRGAGNPPPTFTPAATLKLFGGGNVETDRVRLGVRKPGRRAVRRAARSGRLAIVVRRSSRGLVRATVRARIGGRVRPIGRGRVMVRQQGKAARLRIKLSRPARRSLARGRLLRATIQVNTAGTEPRQFRLALRQPGSRAGRGR